MKMLGHEVYKDKLFSILKGSSQDYSISRLESTVNCRKIATD